jgi:hypothetical protein
VEWLNDNFTGLGHSASSGSGAGGALRDDDDAGEAGDDDLVHSATDEAARTDAIMGPFVDQTYVGRCAMRRTALPSRVTRLG